ncbi:MAG: DUF2203 domain-containing protein [Planctomycetota bacterium]
MSERIFTLDESNQVLPLVRSITRDAVRRYRAAKDEIQALGRLKADRRAGLPVAVDELRAQDARIETHLNELRRLIDELENLGCRLRDYERGVVDFPAAMLDGDQFTFYCWTLGEEQVTYWHREEEGFDQRRLIGAEASA